MLHISRSVFAAIVAFCLSCATSMAALAQPYPTPTQQQQRIQRSLDLQEVRSQQGDIQSIGEAGMTEIRRELLQRGYQIVGEQVRVRAANGALRITDFLCLDRNGRVIAFEAKANDSIYRASQEAADRAIARQGGTVLGGQSLRAGYAGRQVRFPTRVLRVQVWLDITVNRRRVGSIRVQ